MNIKAVIFDMDGILIDSENLWQEVEQALWAELGCELTASHLMQTRGLMSAEMIQHWSDFFGRDQLDQGKLEDLYNQRVLEKFHRQVPLMDGAPEALEFFHGFGIPLALASCSTLEHIHAAIQQHALDGYFELVVSAAEGMPGKPHPEVYLQTAKRLGLEPSTCLAIEDSFFGLISAKAARMKVISMPDPREAQQPRFQAADVVIGSLREINDELVHKLTQA